MTDTTPPSLYKAREPIFPRRVKGRFRTLKWWLMGLTLGIYYITPWLRWDRGPHLPDQAVLIDLAGRRFFFFMIEIWPHEFYFVAGLLIMAGLGLFLFTSALGRVWCGYACPQTVWTDLFILVERWIEGDRNARLRLFHQKCNREKLAKRLVKWAVWLLIGLLTGGAWVFYFADAPQLLDDLIYWQAPMVAYTTITVLTLTTFFFGGFFREQICIYACPWPRIQAAMLDEDSLTVGYRFWRGEPRGHKQKEPEITPQSTQGDCIDCCACVNVCPMGIDIREGQQLACITCALCIDACDDVMDKVGQPRGLISYMALTDEAAEIAGAKSKPIWAHICRVRTLIYTVLWAGVGVFLIAALFLRSDIDISLSPLRNPIYVTLKDGTIRNIYDLRLRNKLGDNMTYQITVAGAQAFALTLEGQASDFVKVNADETFLQRIYIDAPAESEAARDERSDLRLWVTALSDGTRQSHDTVFNGKDD